MTNPLQAQIQPQSTTAKKSLTKNKKDTLIAAYTATPNELTSYSNVSHNIELKAVSLAVDQNFADNRRTAITQQQVSTNIITDPRVGISITRQGVISQYNIEDLDITSFISPNHKTQNTLTTTFEITLSEANGFSFFDRLHDTYKELGYATFGKTPLYMIIRFNGTDANGEQRQLSELTTVHRINISKCNVDHTSTGTVYNITAFAFDNIAKDVKYLLPKVIVVDEVTTVGEALTKLSSEMFVAFNSVISPVRTLYDRYEFAYSDKAIRFGLPTMLLRTTDTTTDSDRQKSLTAWDPLKNTLTCNKFASVLTIVDDLLMATEGWGDHVNKLNEQLITDGKKPPAFLWRVTPNVKIDGFDDKINDFVSTVTFVIDVYETNSINLGKDPSDANGNILSPDFGIEKKYDYLYTGNNTEVLDLSLTYNLSYYALIPAFKGSSTSSAALDYSKSYRPSDVSVAGVKEVSDKLLRAAYSKNTAAIVGLKNELNALTAKTSETHANTTELPNNTDPVPVTYIMRDPDSYENLINDRRNGSVSGSNKDHVNITAAILNQAYVTSADMVSIEMEVKGDPYWLRGCDSIDQPKDSTSLSKDSYALVTFRSPKQGVDSSGLMSWYVNETVSGAYIVTRVDHHFAKGQYTQTLHAFRNSSVNYKSI